MELQKIISKKTKLDIVLFRPICGSLKSSMLQVKAFATFEEFQNYIKECHTSSSYNANEIEIKYSSYDNRIDWQTYSVCIKYKGEWAIIGNINGLFKHETILDRDKWKGL